MSDRSVNSMESSKTLFGMQQVQILCETVLQHDQESIN